MMMNRKTIKIASIVLIALGIALAFWGYHLSASVGSQLTRVVTGSHDDKILVYSVAGVISFVAGAYLNFKK